MASFTEALRDELAHAEVGPECCRRAESAAIVRLAGALHLSGPTPDGAGGAGWVISVAPNAVARRLHRSLTDLEGARSEIEVHRATPLRPTVHRMSLPRPVAPLLVRLGVWDDAGPLDGPPSGLVAASHDATAYVRGALMASGSISDVSTQAHLEIRTHSEATAETVRGLVVRAGGDGARVGQTREGWRTYLKSGEAIGALLATVGAGSAFFAWDDARLRRELRGQANRAANADRANLSRAAGAFARDSAAIEAVVAAVGWDGLPDDLRVTALARLANPEASLAELGRLHQPPVGKATVHRRLNRLASLAEEDPR